MLKGQPAEAREKVLLPPNLVLSRGVRYINKPYRLLIYQHFLKIKVSIRLFLKISIQISIRTFIDVFFNEILILNVDIDKGILQNIDKILYKLGFGI